MFNLKNIIVIYLFLKLPGFRQRAAPSQPEAATPSQPQVEVMVSEGEPVPVLVPERESDPKFEPTEEIPSPPTEPQIAPIDSLTDV
ncbi:hypothetical protein IRJ41_009486 [Triplophysa rosa]|uniref:Uncharacterized protein n=1 Tax=Triplophysa rosa TaxID=992332 RepID=A0A9W7W7P9_TRIRA|nr:hypothetical protein IRJ41_009486 [Triplophysa rosa]